MQKRVAGAPRPNPALGSAWDAGGIFYSNPAKNDVLGVRLRGFSSAGRGARGGPAGVALRISRSLYGSSTLTN